MLFRYIARDLAEMNEICRARFAHFPARTVDQAAQRPLAAKIKVQAIAMRDETVRSCDAAPPPLRKGSLT